MVFCNFKYVHGAVEVLPVKFPSLWTVLLSLAISSNFNWVGKSTLVPFENCNLENENFNAFSLTVKASPSFLLANTISVEGVSLLLTCSALSAITTLLLVISASK